jgi:hypothetical protein
VRRRHRWPLRRAFGRCFMMGHRYPVHGSPASPCRPNSFAQSLLAQPWGEGWGSRLLHLGPFRRGGWTRWLLQTFLYVSANSCRELTIVLMAKAVWVEQKRPNKLHAQWLTLDTKRLQSTWFPTPDCEVIVRQIFKFAEGEAGAEVCSVFGHRLYLCKKLGSARFADARLHHFVFDRNEETGGTCMGGNTLSLIACLNSFFPSLSRRNTGFASQHYGRKKGLRDSPATAGMSSPESRTDPWGRLKSSLITAPQM